MENQEKVIKLLESTIARSGWQTFLMQRPLGQSALTRQDQPTAKKKQQKNCCCFLNKIYNTYHYLI